MIETPWQKWHKMLQRMKVALKGADPVYRSTFRLSKEELAVLDLIVALAIPAAISPELACEWLEAWRLGADYPYRASNPNLICSIGLKEIFKYTDREGGR